ncbi:hypothetical protein R3P38DRAFT_2572315, partial [Favolaschia claudopus]
WRSSVSETILSSTNQKLDDSRIDRLHKTRLLYVAKSLFRDDGSWPLGHSLYYLGQLPNLDMAFPPSQTSDELSRRKLLHHLAADWHLASIRLAGRIFGCLQREMAVRRDGYFGNPNDGFHP